MLAVLTIALTLHPVEDFDVWYHLAGGRLMWDTWTWPRTNTFAYTNPDYPWIDLHWIFQLLLYASYAVGGPNGCLALSVILMLMTVGVLYALAVRSAPPGVVALLLAGALAVASPRLVPRPELLSFALLALFVWLLETHPRCGRWLYLLIPLEVIWTNSQGIFAIGLALIGCYWVGATLALAPLPAGWRKASGGTVEDWRRLTLVLALAAAGCLLNPYGLDGVRFPLELLPRVTGSSFLSSRIGEFMSPLAAGGYPQPLAYTWIALVAVAVASFLLTASRWHLGRLLAVAAFGVLSAQAQRNVALFGWIAAPAIAANLAAYRAGRRVTPAPAARAERRRRSDPRQQRALPAAPSWLVALAPRLLDGVVVAVLVVFIGTIVTNRFWQFVRFDRETGVGLSRLRPPAEAVTFLHEAGISGRPFNCLVLGGYLAWRRFPGEQVFVDPRLETYPELFLQRQFQVLDDPEIWPKLAALYHFDYAILYHFWPNRLPLAGYLSAGHGWELVYYDETTSIYLPIDEAHRAARLGAEQAFAAVQKRRQNRPAFDPRAAFWSRWSVPLEEIWRQRSFGSFLRTIGQPAEAAAAFQRALTLAPDNLDVRFTLGLAYWAADQSESAKREWREILRRDPTDESARQALTEADAAERDEQ